MAFTICSAHLVGWNIACHACFSDCQYLPLRQDKSADGYLFGAMMLFLAGVASLRMLAGFVEKHGVCQHGMLTLRAACRHCRTRAPPLHASVLFVNAVISGQAASLCSRVTVLASVLTNEVQKDRRPVMVVQIGGPAIHARPQLEIGRYVRHGAVRVQHDQPYLAAAGSSQIISTLPPCHTCSAGTRFRDCASDCLQDDHCFRQWSCRHPESHITACTK